MAILEALLTLAAEVDAREDYTRNHSKKVSEYSTYIAKNLGYSNKEIERIRIAALLHDIGRMGFKTSDKLIDSNDPEWKRIRAHPYLAFSLMRYIDGLEEYMPAIRYHHERYDGTGYPDQLEGEEIPLDAQILAVADVYDAMTSPRAYRSAYSAEEVLDYIESSSGSLFNPRVVKAFLLYVSELSEAGVRT